MNSVVDSTLNNALNSELQAAMLKATRLTSSGDLLGATAAIQQSLSTGGLSASPDFRAEHRGADTGRWAQDPDVVSEQVSANTSHTRTGTDDSASGQKRAGTVTHSTFSSHGMTLEYRLSTPSGVTGPAPLLVMLHGCTQDADDFAIGTDMDALANKAGLQVLYPSQSVQRNSRKCWNWFDPAHQRRGGGEVAALHALSETIASRKEIASNQVFVAGMSAGGAMALVLAEQYPELVAGVGVHSGLPSGIAKSVPQALSAMQGTRRPPANLSRSASAAPAIIFHGNADNTVHPSNAEQIVAARIAHTKTTIHTSAGNQAGRAFKRSEYRTTDDQVACEHWELGGTGHQWSGGNPAGSHTDQAGPSASAEMIRFFQQISKAM